MVELEAALPDTVVEVLDELEASYWVPALRGPFDALAKLLAGIEGERNPLREPFKAFVSNLDSAKQLLEFPYALLLPFVLKGTEVEKRLDQLDLTSEEKIDAALEEPGLVVEVYAAAMRSTSNHLRKQPLALTRVMHQGSLLAWAAFETFCKEVFIAVLNRRPSLYGKLLRNQALKERFAISSSGWPHLLEQNGYDLNGKLGTIVGSDRDFSSPQLLKELFPLLLEDLPGPAGFEDAMADERLWVLGNRRHLIAHRCGVVDVDYMRKCHDDRQTAGQLLVLRGRDLAESLVAVARASSFVYGKARHCWDSSGTA
jgi:hypothetical protein